MEPFPIRYDADSNTLLLNEAGGVDVMLAVLLKAKFGEAFDYEMLFHEPLAALMNALRAKSGRRQSDDGPFTREQLYLIAEGIVSESWRSNWWSMTAEEKTAFVQEIVIAPHRLSTEQMADVMDGVESALDWRRRIVVAAETATKS